jgi:hypothetical protein
MIVNSQLSSSVRWYLPDSGDDQQRATQLVSDTAGVEQYQRTWYELNLWNATLFSNRELVGFSWGVVRNDAKELWPSNLHTENLIEEIGESMLSKAASSPLKPSLTPHGKSWKVERAVRLMDEFLFGVWRQTQSEDACVRAWLDAFISGIGCVQDVYDEKTKTLMTEPVFFDQIVVDNRECIGRQPPRTIRIRRVLPRSGIAARYGKELGSTSKRYVDYREVGDGYEVLVEAWRLPDADGDEGRHTVACAGVLLVDEEWNESEFPLEFFHWRDRLSGFLGQSGVEQLVPYQVRQNELNEAIRESQDIACRPRILAHANSNIDLDQWDNEAGRIMAFSGEPPQPFNWPTQLQELYMERDRNYQKAFSHAGQSEMFAHADLPNQVRLDSSAGVREFRNMEDSRHLRLWSRFEDFRLRVARMHLRVLRAHSGATAYTSVYHPARAHAASKRIPFEAVKTLIDDQFSWSLEATPLSQQSPAARRETLRDWVSRGLMDEAQAHRMFTNPNIEREEDLELASQDDVLRHIDIMESGEYEAPTEITNLTYGIKKVVSNYHRLRAYEDVEPVVLENHLQWVAHAVSIQQAAVQMAQDQAAAYQPTQGMAGTSSAVAAPAA